MKETILDQQITRAEAELAELNKVLRKLKQQRAEALCPYKVGQRMVNPKGEVRVITEILPTEWALGYQIRCVPLRKDGKPRAVPSRRLWGFEGWKPEVKG